MNKVERLTIKEGNIKDEKLRADRLANRSAVAQRAFHRELNCPESQREVNTMQDVIERLRLSKQTKIQEIEDEGRMYGSDWAKHHAEYDELRRMAQIDAWGPEQHKGAYEVYEAVTGKKDDEPEEVAEFYLIDIPVFQETATHEFVTGFIEGARGVWDEVENKL